jgi:hypothetical protein
MARCNGDSLPAASARGKWSRPVATAALSTRLPGCRDLEFKTGLLYRLVAGNLLASSTYQLVNYPRYNEHRLVPVSGAF